MEGGRHFRLLAPPHPLLTLGLLHTTRLDRRSELLRFELAATPQMRIVQLCVVDHSGDAYRANAHIHVQCLLSDRTRSQWVQLNATLADLRSAAHAVLSGHVRIHLHDPQPGDKRKPEAADAVQDVAMGDRMRALLEATTLSEGRGTTRPFSILGAPWLRAVASVYQLAGLAACWMEPVSFKMRLPCTAAASKAWKLYSPSKQRR